MATSNYSGTFCIWPLHRRLLLPVVWCDEGKHRARWQGAHAPRDRIAQTPTPIFATECSRPTAAGRGCERVENGQLKLNSGSLLHRARESTGKITGNSLRSRRKRKLWGARALVCFRRIRDFCDKNYLRTFLPLNLRLSFQFHDSLLEIACGKVKNCKKRI